MSIFGVSIFGVSIFGVSIFGMSILGVSYLGGGGGGEGDEEERGGALGKQEPHLGCGEKQGFRSNIRPPSASWPITKVRISGLPAVES